MVEPELAPYELDFVHVAEDAEHAGREPSIIYSDEELEDCPPFPEFPLLGNYVPEGWRRVDTLFVDTTGVGRADEPALTTGQVKERIRTLLRSAGEEPSDPLVGFGFTEVGQFQAHLGVYLFDRAPEGYRKMVVTFRNGRRTVYVKDATEEDSEEDYAGVKRGALTVGYQVRVKMRKHTDSVLSWVCACDCGNICLRHSAYLRTNGDYACSPKCRYSRQGTGKHREANPNPFL